MTRTMPFALAGLLAAVAVTGAVMTACAQVGDGPTLLHSSVLNGVKIEQDTGEVYLYQIQVRDLPPPAGAGYYPYNPDTGGKLWAVLSSAAGAQIARFDFSAQRLNDPYWLLKEYRLTDLRTGQMSNTGRVGLTPGVYVLDFFLEGTHFWTFAFGVSSLTDNAGQTGWFLDGPWEDWAYMFYADGNPQSGLMWKVWMRNKMVNLQRSARVSVEVTRDGDGQMVCQSNLTAERLLQPYWVRFEFPLDWPADSEHPGLTMVAQTLLANDGAYTVTVKIEQQPYAQWKFSVANGQLARVPRTDPATADPMTFIQGGDDAWWYEREGAPSLVVPTGGTTTGGTTGGTTAAEQEVPPPQVIAGATPITVNGHTMVPLRSIFEWLGAEVKYIPQALSIIANKGDDIIVLMRLDEDEATVNGRKVPLTQRPVEQGGVTYVPLRFVAETFGATVAVDPATGNITITDGQRVGIIPKG